MKSKLPIVGSVVKLADFQAARSGENNSSLDLFAMAKSWEVCPAIDVMQVVESDNPQELLEAGKMLPGIFLESADGQKMGITLNPKDALTMAKFFMEYTGKVLGDATEEEVRELIKGFTGSLMKQAYSNIRYIVEKDNALEVDLRKQRAVAEGMSKGLVDAKETIRKLTRAAALPEGMEKESLLEELEPAVRRALEG